MNRFLTILSLLFVLTYHTHAQLSLGLKAGFNANDIRQAGAPSGVPDSYKWNIGFHLGFFGELPLGSKLSLIPELQFSQRGATADKTSLNPHTRLNINYLDLPVLLSYKAFGKLGIDLGPTFSYKLSAKKVVSGSRLNVTDFYKDFDFGIAAGIRVHVTTKISAIGRYYRGLGTIDKVYYADANNKQSIITFHNQTIQFGLAYTLK